jgi:hypothetical protein
VDCSTGFWAVAMVLKKSVISLPKCTTAAVPLHPFAFRWCTLDPKAWIHRPYWTAQVLQTPSSRFTSLEMFHANHIPCLQTRKADLVISLEKALGGEVLMHLEFLQTKEGEFSIAVVCNWFTTPPKHG